MNRIVHAIPILILLVNGLEGITAEPERLNLVAIVTDDQAHWSLGCYGNRESRTPHMDRLAREGVRFVNAFVPTPVCSPSRVSYLTGRYGTQVGITDWISPEEAKAGLGLPASAVTWPSVLQKHGYITGLIGKWHLGSRPEFHPTRHGFHHFFGFLGGGNQPMNPVLEVNGKDQPFQGPLPDLLIDDALRFVESHRSKPFALLVHFREPHTPYTPVPEQDIAPFHHLDPTIPKAPGIDPGHVKRLTREYYGSIHAIDRNLGRLLARLDELQLTPKTIVLFTSDHGYMIGQHTLWHKGNGHWIAGGVVGPKRPNMFEESIRVPLLIRWPNVVKPGTEIPQMVSGIDTFASVLGMLGVPLPPDVKQEGMDFTPLLRGEKITWRDALFGQYDLHNGGLAYLRMIRTEQWKYVQHLHAQGLDELYHLKEDPGELRNLVRDPKHQLILAQLRQRLLEWRRAINDPQLR